MAQKLVMVSELPELEVKLPQAENAVRAHHVSFEDFLKLFCGKTEEETTLIRGKIRGSALGEGVTHVVAFENLDMWSSQFGRRSSLIVGSKQTFTIEKVLGTPMFRLGDVPSRFQYPVAYASVEELRKELPLQEKEPAKE